MGVGLAAVLAPAALRGQAAPPQQVVWLWFGDCAPSTSMALDVTFEGKPVYQATFPICQRRRSDIKHEPQQRIIEFQFTAPPARFRAHAGLEPRTIRADIWEDGLKPDSLLLGLSFTTGDSVLLNTTHLARPRAASRSERARGLVIITRPAP